jgi:hypothetical protein
MSNHNKHGRFGTKTGQKNDISVYFINDDDGDYLSDCQRNGITTTRHENQEFVLSFLKIVEFLFIIPCYCFLHRLFCCIAFLVFTPQVELTISLSSLAASQNSQVVFVCFGD